MHIVIIDGYTDEPSGLGVPPYIGTYPRYLAGKAMIKYPGATVTYLTVDDLRAMEKGISYHEALKKRDEDLITNISIYNVTRDNVQEVLEQADTVFLICGVQVPGKYLSARPANLSEMHRLTKDIKAKKVLTGPAASSFGSQVQGGKRAEQLDDFDLQDYEILEEDTLFETYEELRDIAIKGAQIVDQFPVTPLAEIEISQGCWRKMNCSFCTEPLRMDDSAFREQQDIADEMKVLYEKGVTRFRLGRSTCVYSYKKSNPEQIKILFEKIHEACPKIDVLHIDNVRPELVITKDGIEITKTLVQYCTDGNIAAFGCESFDPEVAKANRLNAWPDANIKAIQVLNEYGSEKGPSGIPKFLPGINLIFGLLNETKQTHEHNLKALTDLTREGNMLRRINIRQVVPFKGTHLYDTAGAKFLRKNQKYYFKWRDEIRQQVDIPQLEMVFPKGQIIHNVMTEIYDGNTTFARQFGTYPIVMGIKGRHPLRQFVSVKVIGYMKRSLIVEIVN